MRACVNMCSDSLNDTAAREIRTIRAAAASATAANPMGRNWPSTRTPSATAAPTDVTASRRGPWRWIGIAPPDGCHAAYASTRPPASHSESTIEPAA